MSAPPDLSFNALKRLCRYLIGRQRLVYKLPFQQATHVDVYSDTDWAGCVKILKSISGGCIMVGRHILKIWSSTQPSVTMSSGEAEYYGEVKASGVAIRHRSLMADLSIPLAARVWTDSSAAIGICNRAGLGNVRHIQTHTSWVQERVRNWEFNRERSRVR